MRKLLLLFTLSLLTMTLTSCSSDVVVEAKLKAASKVKEIVNKELTKAFEDISVEGVDCSVEAVDHSEYVYDKVLDFLKVAENGAEKSLSTGNSEGLIYRTCVFIVDRGLLYLIDKSGDSSLCLKELGRVKVIDLVDVACSKLEI